MAESKFDQCHGKAVWLITCQRLIDHEREVRAGLIERLSQSKQNEQESRQALEKVESELNCLALDLDDDDIQVLRDFLKTSQCF